MVIQAYALLRLPKSQARAPAVLRQWPILLRSMRLISGVHLKQPTKYIHPENSLIESTPSRPQQDNRVEIEPSLAIQADD